MLNKSAFSVIGLESRLRILNIRGSVPGILGLAMTYGLLSHSAAASPPYAFLSTEDLQKNRQLITEQQAPELTQEAYSQLIRQADKALARENMSVMDKRMTPPSGSKHDYLSLSAYWWPDSQRPDVLPWVRQDGDINPASKNEDSDGVRLADFTAQVQALTLAWYFSGQQKYADKAVGMIRAWFLVPATRMNPNLNFAQGVPGVAEGRGSGVLDGRYFAIRVVDSLIMLRKNPSWTAQDEQQMHQWMTDYLYWLQTSPLGKKEAAAKNNHGSWYKVQVAGIAWYLQRDELVLDMAEQMKPLLNYQLEANGAQPLELARTRSFHYSDFNLQAVTQLATLANNLHLDLWRYQTPNGSGLLKALDFMAPYIDKNLDWPYPTRDRFGIRLIPLLSQADKALGQPRYQHWIALGSFSPPTGKSVAKARGAVNGALRDNWLLQAPETR
ncbi:alginate lyase family protein [Yersinia sp. J1]|uniref:alginate lyase family protein n=1 Tax=Yersinia sp. J1 TaxID=3424774 RepID=UPI003D3688A4